MYGALTSMSSRDIGTSCRIFILIIGLLETLVFSGVLFGWADLVYLMKVEGVFAGECRKDFPENDIVHCHPQDNLFDLAFTLVTFSKGSAFVLVAFILDRFGLRASRIIANLQVTVGGFMIGYSAKATPYLLYPGILLVGFGGSQIRMNSFVLANLFPNHKSTVLSFYNGAFCASAAIFLLFKYAHHFGIDMETAFVLWAGISGLMIAPTMLLLPSRTIKDDYEESEFPVNQSPKESTSKVKPDDTNSSYRQSALETSLSPSGKKKVYGAISCPGSREELHQDIPVQESFFSSVYIAHLIWSCVSGLVLAVYTGSFNPWVENITKDNRHSVSKMTELYGICQIPMIVVPPLGGLLLDYSLNQAREEPDPVLRRKKACWARFSFLFVTTLIEIVQIAFMFFETLLAVQLSLFVYIFTRPMVNAVSVVHLRVSFPSTHFNRLLGVMGTIVAVFSLLQFPLFMWSGQHAFSANMTVMVMVILSLANPFISLFGSRTFV